MRKRILFTALALTLASALQAMACDGSNCTTDKPVVITPPQQAENPAQTQTAPPTIDLKGIDLKDLAKAAGAMDSGQMRAKAREMMDIMRANACSHGSCATAPK